MGVKKPKSEHRKPMSISLTKALLLAADKRSALLGKSRSEYIRDLILSDIKERESC
jgi:metal-responsive CopG/Arc/MetJ family transcriptional regulator